MSSRPIVQMEGVDKSFVIPGSSKLEILKEAEFTVKKGEIVSIIGPSGVGKSTLLYLLAGIDFPDKGEILIDGTSIIKRSETWLSKFRGRNIGFIYQFFGLLPTLTALENILLAMSFKGIKGKKAYNEATELLGKVGLSDKEDYHPNSMSGGEQQRVAIARALAGNPKLVIGDEITGSLDNENSSKLLKLLNDLVKAKGISLVLVTHDQIVSQLSERTFELKKGKLFEKEAL